MCPYLVRVAARIWDLPDNTQIQRPQLINANLMPPIKCCVCLDHSPWSAGTDLFMFCALCFRATHTACAMRQLKMCCPYCRHPQLLPNVSQSRSHNEGHADSMEVDTPKQSGLKAADMTDEYLERMYGDITGEEEPNIKLKIFPERPLTEQQKKELELIFQ